MNRQEKDIMNELAKCQFTNQRELSEDSGHSLGVVNRSIKELKSEGYLDEEIRLTDKAKKELKEKSPKNAVILAAGFGMRMVPINTEIPKGLLEVNGEVLIERTIRQLHEAGIHEIYVVVGFMKEKYEYLIDEFGVKLIVNSEYAEKNNLYSLKKVIKYISNTYIIPCDIWCKNNPYSSTELYSWYMVSDMPDEESAVRVNRKMELTTVLKSTGGNAMIGISYLVGDEAQLVCQRIEQLCNDVRNDNAFWEETLYCNNKMIVAAKVVPHQDVTEINTYEQLRDLDSNSKNLNSDTIDIICEAMNAKKEDIRDITVLKKGMTNRSFLFSYNEKKYIMRIPGEGTDHLINRKQEAQVYNTIKDIKICDDIMYINPDNGYKITEFINGARVCDPFDKDDVKKCMKVLRGFHERKLKVDHEFDIFRQLEFYESLWGDTPSVYKDYKDTKDKVLSLKSYIFANMGELALTHIDAVPDNFIFWNNNGMEDIRLIDWEYAGMQDPHVDVAMFCIYAMYEHQQVEELIDAYFPEGCTSENRIKIYCYIAVCGLLWSNWCEYKRNLGVDFGEYSLRQYRYAKEYYRIAQSELSKKNHLQEGRS